MNVPFGIAAVVFATTLMPHIDVDHVPPLDVRGFLLSGLGLSATVFGFTIMGRDLLPGFAPYALALAGLGVLALYVRHARATPSPILDLKLLRVPTFRAGVLGGSLFRVGVGAVPFLTPLMFQLGFGLSAFESGMISCAMAAGAISMKFGAATLIRHFGFKRLLMVNGVLASLSIAVVGLLSPHNSYWLLLPVLFAGGFLRSLQFTAMNAMSYGDMESRDMSHATSLYTVIQHLSLSAGVVLAAFVLEGAQFAKGEVGLVPGDFAIAFVVVSVFAAASVLWFRPLASDAGSAVSGRIAQD